MEIYFNLMYSIIFISSIVIAILTKKHFEFKSVKGVENGEL